MKLTEMIGQLDALLEAHGNLEVLISDGVRGLFYKGDFEIGLFEHSDQYVDIGIGLCLEDDRAADNR